MAQIGLYDFVLILLGNVGYLSISIGFLLIFATIIKYVGKVELIHPEDKKMIKQLRIISILIILTGVGIIYYPCTVNITGFVENEETKAGLGGVKIMVGNINDTTDENGVYMLSNVPRNECHIYATLKSSTVKKELKIPRWAGYFGLLPQHPYNGPKFSIRRENYTIEGKVIDEFGYPVIGAGISNQDNKLLTKTDEEGHFRINILCDPEKRTYVKISQLVRYPYLSVNFQNVEVFFSADETASKYKECNINFSGVHLIDIAGTIISHCSPEESPIPLIGTKIEIDGKSNVTDIKGNYLIKNVNKKSKEFFITIKYGTKNEVTKNDTITPPLEDESKNTKIAQRNIWICLDS